jgi:hypothetical protein
MGFARIRGRYFPDILDEVIPWVAEQAEIVQMSPSSSPPFRKEI